MNTRPFRTLLTLALAFMAALPLVVAQATAAGGALLRVGDRVKVTFFETMEVPDPAKADAVLLQTFYQRVDLSGEYVVEAGGRLFIPLFGAIECAGRSLELVQGDLMQAFEKTMGRRGSVTLSIVQRPPVFVTGGVRNPGSYPYGSGMIVLQAIALAGGVDGRQASMSALVERLREAERAEAARDRLRTLLARRAVLQAEQEGGDAAEIPARLRDLTSAGDAEEAMAAARRLGRLRAAERRATRDARQAAVEAARREVDMMAQRVTDFDAQLKVRADRLRTMEALFARQVVEDARVGEVRRDYVDMEGRRREYQLALLQAQQRAVDAERALEAEEQRVEVQLASELGEIEAEIRRQEQALATSRTVLAAMATEGGDGAQGAPQVDLEIVRNGVAAPERLRASETDAVEPGDVIRVIPRREALPRRGHPAADGG